MKDGLLLLAVEALNNRHWQRIREYLLVLGFC